jgi:hypothetical protein
MKRIPLVVFTLFTVGGCSLRASSNVCASGNCGRSEEALSAKDLISTSTCTLRGTHLVNCAIGTQPFSFTPFETAVPMRTTVTSQKSGNCSTPYSLQVSLTADSEPAVTFPFIANSQVLVKRADRGEVSSLTVADSSPWTKFATFDQSCAISLQVNANTPDVDTKADAQAIINQLTTDVTNKQQARDNARALDLYAKAFTFLRNVAENFLGQLTNQQMQDLRAAANDAQPALESLITDCNNLTPDQRAVLLRLDLGLAVLGSPQDWQNSDGGVKSLGDFLSPADQQALQQIVALDSPDGGAPNYDAQYQAAETAYETAVHKLQLGQQQLAAWLN